ncbi:hypothetical protein GCM10011579_056600 [Streptomyces albiflavescens]|uniref:Lipoprotein n=1 Tax=Streptomyces albiflavescens TaxID=1623582 RepID=A0A917Y7U1_9ACTN|nr:hypothetical protein [Streptomyces albiflavescens]GGN76022.1 hypothetical protein GCM10011579_056600 [Streptomyces albiflavescens]
MRHRGATATGVLAGLRLLSGCSPASLPLVAVWPGADGQPVVAVRPCDGDHATGLRLSSWAADAYIEDPSGGVVDNPSSTASPGQVDTRWAVRSGVEIGRTTFPLFSPPSAWHAQRIGPQKLGPGRVYSLDFTGARQGWDPYDGRLGFTAADLASLHPGQVWADGRAMSRDAFDDLVDDKC